MNSKQCDLDCREMDEVRKTLYGQDGTGGLVGCTKKLDKRKVSWTTLATIVMIFLTISGATWLKVDWSRAKDVEKVEKACDTNSKKVQTFSINQAVLMDKVNDIKHQMEKQEQERKEDVKTLHRRINEFGSKLDKILHEVKKP